MSKAPTKAEQRRFLDLQEIGCMACRIEGSPGEPSDIHHLVEGGKRLGHSYTIPLCPWHHRGISELPANVATHQFGPSLARSKRAFVERYGTERALLRKANKLLSLLKLAVHVRAMP